jgi:hypothetical protein
MKTVALLVTLTLASIAWCDSFLTSVTFSCEGPTFEGPEEVALSLDEGAIDVSCALSNLKAMNGYDCNGEMLNRLIAMREAFRSSGVEFCLGFVEVYNATWCDEPEELATKGLTRIENVIYSGFGDATAWLTYGLCLLQTDAFVLGESWDEVNELKQSAAQAIRYGERLAAEAGSDPDYEATHESMMSYIVLYPGVATAYDEAEAERPRRQTQGGLRSD